METPLLSDPRPPPQRWAEQLREADHLAAITWAMLRATQDELAADRVYADQVRAEIHAMRAVLQSRVRNFTGDEPLL